MEKAREVMARCFPKIELRDGATVYPPLDVNFPILPEEIAAALDAFAAEAVREERDEIMRRCDGYSTGKCSGHEDNPCCHKRTAAAIAAWIEARGKK